LPSPDYGTTPGTSLLSDHHENDQISLGREVALEPAPRSILRASSRQSLDRIEPGPDPFASDDV
jgi:hypothetical protein